MVTYRIKDWDTLFETSETRKLVRLNWVPIPNKHDGKGYRRLIRSGALNYAAWVLLLQVASKCPQRGVLADQDGPLTPDDLFIKTDCPASCFTAAIPKLLEIGWLEESPGVPADSPGAPADPPGGREGKGIEEKEEKTTTRPSGDASAKASAVVRKFVVPSPAEVQAYLDSIGETRFSGEGFCAFYESKGWRIGKSPMKSWQAAVRTWRANADKKGEPQVKKPVYVDGIAQIDREW